MPARLCIDCGALCQGPRCPTHTAARQRRRGSATQRGYGAAWRRLVAEAKQEQRRQYGYAWCLDCGHTGSPANPLSGDHLRWPARTLADVQVVCRVCNSRRPDRRTGVITNRQPR